MAYKSTGMKLPELESVRRLREGGPGSGRHKEAGTFKRTGSQDKIRKDGSFQGSKDSYEGKKGTSVEVHRLPFEGTMHDVRSVVTQDGKRVHDGSESSAKSFLKEKYGINHKN